MLAVDTHEYTRYQFLYHDRLPLKLECPRFQPAQLHEIRHHTGHTARLLLDEISVDYLVGETLAAKLATKKLCVPAYDGKWRSQLMGQQPQELFSGLAYV